MPYLRRPDGCLLYHELHGPPLAPPLVLLEGMGGDIPGWRRNIPTLSSRYLVVAHDLRGNGKTESPDAPMAIATFVEDTVALMDHLGLEAAHLYGQSLGGMVAQEMALSYPERVRSLVLACTHAGVDRAARPGKDARVPKDRPYLALYSESFAREHPDHVAEDILVGSQNPQPAWAGRRQWEGMQAWSAWDRLPLIRAKALVLHGTEDRLIPVENAVMLAERIPGAELVLLEGAGHVYHSEQPEAADRAVLSFLDSVEGVSPWQPG